MSHKRSYAVIGLGIFGSAIAKTLARAGQDVIAIDRDINCVENVSDVIENAVQADANDIAQLKEAGIQDVDVAVIAMGSHLEDSIMAILHLKELHVPEIIAKANNHNYMYVLQKVGADKVIQPEKEMGKRIALRLLTPNIVDLINVDDNYSIVEIKAPKAWHNTSLIDLSLRSKFGVNVIGIRSKEDSKLRMTVSPHDVIKPDDNLMIVAETEKFKKLNLE